MIIKPYYIKDHNRNSQKNELDTIALLTMLIRSLHTTKCILYELITENRSDVTENDDISKAYEELKQEYKKDTNKEFGDQYEWLARFAINIKNLEFSFCKDDSDYKIIIFMEV